MEHELAYHLQIFIPKGNAVDIAAVVNLDKHLPPLENTAKLAKALGRFPMNRIVCGRDALEWVETLPTMRQKFSVRVLLEQNVTDQTYTGDLHFPVNKVQVPVIYDPKMPDNALYLPSNAGK